MSFFILGNRGGYIHEISAKPRLSWSRGRNVDSGQMGPWSEAMEPVDGALEPRIFRLEALHFLGQSHGALKLNPFWTLNF